MTNDEKRKLAERVFKIAQDPWVQEKVKQGAKKLFKPQPPPPSGLIGGSRPSTEGLVKFIVFRKSGGSGSHPVFLDDEKLCDIEASEHLLMWEEPGRHVFVAEKGSKVEINFKVGTTYHLKTSPTFWLERGIIEASTSDEWEREMPKSKHVPAKRINLNGKRRLVGKEPGE